MSARANAHPARTIVEQTGLVQYADGVQMLQGQKDSLDEHYRMVNEDYRARRNPYLCDQ